MWIYYNVSINSDSYSDRCVFLFTDRFKKTPEYQEEILESDNSANFLVKENCQPFVKPNIESDVSGNLEIGQEFFVEDIDKFNYFYEITAKSGKKAFVRKEYLKRK